ncbi:50S ribosomal protein L4 [Candidatus Woesebacteria bacterium RBG_19FT_COMBO_42_9]|uniref:Large ribosomal subunit protein uL4 n=1 Tax=Candidatus Woesebacteria bacterium RBG_16_42_24 TaxID=1802485 RepID=A0A1F7XMA5_9BACT|nr:MAG: 50S ribosomal protein L4 [Candidatus Woesebacteria bacterium RBG_16_42_24]OGM17738.1 MAG: 50S ribosomal protein L4 [Candidatus Woesebacteria bacterium RBG_19FT_COMBO_42_9]OGM66826.1 MAG: 50S ribosomal protein L4 [Candidatus Woesebacteria bacterium RIFCSPLOWO2_01_FULL_43_11]
MTKANVYSAKGVKSGSVNLPKDFNENQNLALLAQAIRVQTARAHIGLAKVKTRAEVDRTKKKVYRQKGTGGARHGSRSAPIYVGGGVAHGPKGVKRELTLPKILAKKALNIALTLKAKDGEVVVVNGLGAIAKTKEIQSLIDKIKKTRELKKGRFTFALANTNLESRRSLKNLEGVAVLPYENLNAYRVFYGGVLVLDKDVFTKKPKTLNSKLKTTKIEINK